MTNGTDNSNKPKDHDQTRDSGGKVIIPERAEQEAPNMALAAGADLEEDSADHETS